MTPRIVTAPRGATLSAKSWQTEAPLRMLMNNLDPMVAERPEDLVVYGGIGRAARNWECFDQIVATLKEMEDDETLLIQSGKPVGVFRTHRSSPRVLIANSNLVPHWATWEHFNELDRKGLMMFGQMTAGSWIYIGSQGIVQGTYETFVSMGRRHFGGDLAGRWILTAGLGGMGGAQPLAAKFAGASLLAIECRQERIDKRLATGYLDLQADSLEHGLQLVMDAGREKKGHYRRGPRQCRRGLPAAGRPRGASRCGDRPDQRPRPAARLPAQGLDGGRVGGAAAERAGCGDAGRPPVDGRPCPGHARFPARWASRPLITATISARRPSIWA